MEDLKCKVLKLLLDSPLSNYKISADTGISDQSIANYRRGKSNPDKRSTQTLAKYFELIDAVSVDAKVPTIPDNSLQSLVESQQRVIEMQAEIIKSLTNK